MWTTILTKVQDTVGGISEIKESYNYPLQAKPSKFPSIVYFPRAMVQNDFDSTSENFKVFDISLSVLVSVSNQTLENVFSKVLPKIADRVVEEFDKEWNYGSLDGHRIWARLSTGDVDYSIDKAGGVASMNMTLQVKMNTDN